MKKRLVPWFVNACAGIFEGVKRCSGFRDQEMTKRERELLEQGWERKSIADEPRLSELVETYQSLGFEVLLEPVPVATEKQEGSCGDCLICFDNERRDRYKVIFTRRARGFQRGEGRDGFE